MSLPALFTLARIAVAGLLFWALADHSYNFYVVLRWAVFLVAGLGAYRAYQQKDREWIFVLAHIALAITFNPFTPLHLARSTWNVINVISALALLFTLLVIDDEPINHFLGTSAGQKITRTLGIMFGIIVIFIGVVILHYTLATMWDGAKLYWSAERSQAQVFKVKHRLESSENDHGGGQIFDAYEVSYEFQIAGKTYTGGDSLYLGTMRDSYGDRFDDLYKEEITLLPNERVPIQIEYEPNNPDNNKAVEGMNGHSSWTLGGAVLLAIGAYMTIFGFNTSLRNVKDLFTRKPASADDEREVA